MVLIINLKLWFSKLYRQLDYVKVLFLICVYLIAIGNSILAALFFWLAGDSNSLADNIPFLFCIIYVLGNALLLLFFIYTRWLNLFSYLFSIFGGMFLIILSLNNFEDAKLIHLIWFAMVPISLVAINSILLVIAGAVFFSIITGIMQAAVYQVYGINDVFAFYQHDASKILLPTLVFLISISLSFGFLITLRIYASQHINSVYDKLTGFLNRYLLELDSELFFTLFKKQQINYYILFADLDRFKEVNDLFGHEIGDKILVILGERLCALSVYYQQEHHLPLNVYRFGGDEFLLMIQQDMNDVILNKMIKDITNTIQNPYYIGDYKIEIGVSIGLAKSNASADSATELINFADTAMYANKLNGKMNYPLQHTAYDAQHWQKSFFIYKELKTAIAEEQFHLLYQPIYYANTLRIKGVEVLMRWQSRSVGAIAPDEFIAVAETTGVIQQLSQWTMKEAFTTAMPWFLLKPDFILTINISPYELRGADFITELHTIIEKYVLSHQGNIMFEVTESAPITHSQHINNVLKEIHAQGIRLSLDDYGQGSTSFLNLRQAPFHAIKLDKQLVWDASKNDRQTNIIKAAVHSAHSLGLEVIAEGIETQQHYDLVRELNCDAVQGYWLSHPITAEAMTALLVAEGEIERGV